MVRKLLKKKYELKAFNALTRYSKKYGEPSEKTLAMVANMIDEHNVESEDQVISAIVLSEEMEGIDKK